MKNRSRRVRLSLLPAVAVALFALLAGCTAVPAVPASTTTPAPGVVSGHVYWTSGIDPGDSPVPAKLTATLIHGSAPIIHDFEAGQDGSFSVGLPPGQYTITGFFVGKYDNLLTTPVNVTVRSGATIQVDLRILLP